jgi:NAD+ diphosphatase
MSDPKTEAGMVTGRIIPFADPGFGNAMALDRAAHKRGQADALWSDPMSRGVLISDTGVALDPIDPCGLARIPVEALAPHCHLSDTVFLGDWRGAPCFAVPFSADQADIWANHPTADFRSAALTLPADAAQVVATGRSLLGWHDSHRFCARCGQPSRSVDGGWKRVCTACSAEHFPRTDPVVIMLAVADDPERGPVCLVGRGPAWPERRVSALAGFMEPGETLAGACARELFEEVGIRIDAVRFWADQPWPFPSSLMIGLFARATGLELKLDPTEIAEAVWLTRAEVAQALAGQHPQWEMAPAYAIAHHMLRAFADGEGL